jgi:RNA polymerase sigma-70 factor (ECF subfamily)
MASEAELSHFLHDVEKRAFKRALYHVRNEETALDIVQDSMLKLSEHYGDRPAAELPMLFQRILSNCTMDWFRRQKSRDALFVNYSEFTGADEDGEFDLLEVLAAHGVSRQTDTTQGSLEQAQKLRAIEAELQRLPPRQREAFLLRYWEELDVAETAAAMGVSAGSVKVHCFRAVQTLSLALRAKGITL